VQCQSDGGADTLVCVICVHPIYISSFLFIISFHHFFSSFLFIISFHHFFSSSLFIIFSMTIAVLMGGISPERNVSFASGKAVAEALTANGHNVRAIDPALGAAGLIDLATFTANASIAPTDEELRAFQPIKLVECVQSSLLDGVDVAFLVVHGKYGEDGYIQSLLDLRGVAYTGSKMLASAVAMSKQMSKRVFQASGIPTPPFASIRAEQMSDYDVMKELRSEFGSHLVIKPDDQGSTVGMSFVKSGNLDDIKHGVELAARYSRAVLVEPFVEGRELTVAVLGEDALPIIEIQPHEGEYDYANKYTKGRTEYICPAELDEATTEFVQNLAIDAHHALGCTGYSRVDFRLDDDGQPFCLEVNTLPGMTETSLVPKAAAAAGMSFGELCEKIIALS
jgi:D-alanine-D-alanine ligase